MFGSFMKLECISKFWKNQNGITISEKNKKIPNISIPTRPIQFPTIVKNKGQVKSI